MNNFKRPTMLMILDGYGISENTDGNAIAAADKPNLDAIFAKYPGTTLKACGLDVGLPEGQMGNSEVGHLNIGAGRIVYQDLTMITKSIQDGSFFDNAAFLKAVDHVKKNGSTRICWDFCQTVECTAISAICWLSQTWQKRTE